MIYFDPMKLERPHRSGVIAVMIGYAFLWALGFVMGDHRGDGFSLSCELLPVLCPANRETETVERQQKEYTVTHLVYCPRCRVRKREKHGCDVEYTRPGGPNMTRHVDLMETIKIPTHLPEQPNGIPELLFTCTTNTEYDQWQTILVDGTRITINWHF